MSEYIELTAKLDAIDDEEYQSGPIRKSSMTCNRKEDLE